MNLLEEIVGYLKGLKLLYVEDNQDARKSTVMILKEFFSDITIAIDGQDGLDKFNINYFDIVITDIRMPRLNGLKMTKEIRKINKNIPILILSAYDELNFFMESIKLSVDGYLMKPIDVDQFLETLDKVTQKMKLADEVETNIHFLNEHHEAINNSSIVSKTNLKGVITYVNKQFCKISEYTQEELIGQNSNMIRHIDTPKEIFEDMWNTIQNEKNIWKGVLKNKTKSGKSYYVDATIKPILNKNNDVVEYIIICNNITDIMNPKKQLDDAIKNKKEPLIVYMKLEEFKMLEEFYNNVTIEKIQDKIDLYLEEHLPKTFKFEKVYQLGNGEYAMVNEKSFCMEDEDNFINSLKIFQNNIKGGAIDIDDIHYDMSIIISMAYGKTNVLESSKLGIEKLLHTKQNFIISNNFSQIEQENALKNMKTIDMVKKALAESRIISYFQPIINNKTKTIEKYESLVRLIDEDDKVLSPFHF